MPRPLQRPFASIDERSPHLRGQLRRIAATFILPGPMDLRLALVASPILLAVGWAGFNIGRAAVGQLQLMIKRSRA